jgi:hypothetical protein
VVIGTQVEAQTAGKRGCAALELGAKTAGVDNGRTLARYDGGDSGMTMTAMDRLGGSAHAMPARVKKSG